MTKATKSFQKTDETKPAQTKAVTTKRAGKLAALGGEVASKIRADVWSKFKHDHAADLRLGRFMSYKRALQSGDASETQQVINAAAYQDRLADEAVRLHIAELIDEGRELTAQLRAYTVMHLVNPTQIMRRRDGD